MSNKNQISREDTSSTLLGDIRIMIEESRLSVAVSVNAALTLLYWRIGKRIKKDILKGRRAQYGQEIVVSLSRQLSQENGYMLRYSALTSMEIFASAFPEPRILATLPQQLSWSHFKEITNREVIQ